ncbi:MAG TPA: peptidoglycan editing factor PgeF [Bacillales bacterium]|nr:peptidoglycan editing factor PgeF [Bacillales bacterium]
MEPFVLQNTSYFILEEWMKRFPGLVAGITAKTSGFSKGEFESLNLGFHVGDELQDVLNNRKKISSQIGFPLEKWVGAEQTHHDLIRKVHRGDRGKGSDSYDTSFSGTDGFYTDEKGILLTLCFADCVPLFFLAPELGMIGAAHAGWKGTVKQIAKNMVELWQREGIRPEQIFVAIGPSICEKCYIVDKHVIDFVQKILEDVEKKPYNRIKEDQYSLDLREVNQIILLNAGIPAQNILVTEYCSSCNEMQFFSHRRNQGHTGRMLSFIGWKEDSSHL